MLVGRVQDLLGYAPGPSCPDETMGFHTHALQLINDVADGCRNLAWVVNVPREATGEIALAYRQHQDFRV